MIDLTYSASSFVGFVSSIRMLQMPPNSRIKSEGLPVSVVIVIDKNIGEGPNRQLHCALKFRTFSLTPCFSEVLRDSAQCQTASAVFLDGCGKPPKRLRRHGLLPAPS